MLRWVFVDMNSYFASVEQHLRPELRGKPVAVAGMDVDSTACIAASYEAKAFGVKTGTLVGMARHLCPGLIVVPARSEEYVEMHHRICEVIEDRLHIERILSIDEMACRLPSNFAEEGAARSVALGIKEDLRRRIGPCVRCSIGIAPNRFLAKVGSDMQKPDGLVVIQQEELPGKILGLGVRDLPGVGAKREVELAAHGADTMAALWRMSEEQLMRAWGGIGGRELYRNLHGEAVVDVPARKWTVGHSSVLAPERRNEAWAYAVMVRLVHKAAARLRHMGYAAGRMSVHVRYAGSGGAGWDGHIGIEDGQDTQTLLEAMRAVWAKKPAGVMKKVGMTLSDLERAEGVTLPLFGGDEKRLELARAMDRINGRFGRQRIYFGEMHETRKAAGMRIAFGSVPEENW